MEVDRVVVIILVKMVLKNLVKMFDVFIKKERNLFQKNCITIKVLFNTSLVKIRRNVEITRILKLGLLKITEM